MTTFGKLLAFVLLALIASAATLVVQNVERAEDATESEPVYSDILENIRIRKTHKEATRLLTKFGLL